MVAPDPSDIPRLLDYWIPKAFIVVVFFTPLISAYRNRSMPRIGGKIGRRSPYVPANPLPDGFSRVECRRIVTYSAPAEPDRYATLKAYMRDGTQRQPALVHIYRVAGFRTRIEIPAGPPDYERIDATEALALLRELPDPRLVDRLHISDEPAFLDPWWRRVIGRDDIYHQGNANSLGLVVLYLPDRRLGPMLGTILMHEWMHLLAYNSRRAVRRFKRADKLEPLPPSPIPPMAHDRPRSLTYEAWADLGEKLFDYDEAAARAAALAAPVHAMILWRCVEKAIRKVPKRLASARLAEFEARGALMRREVAPKARALLQGRWLTRLRIRP